MVIDIETIQILQEGIAAKIAAAYQEQIEKLVADNVQLREELKVFKDQLKSQETTPQMELGNDLPVNAERFESLEKELNSLRDLVSHLKSEPEEVVYDLRKEFANEILFGKSKLKLDWESKAMTATIAQSIFKSQLEKQKKKVVDGFENYKYGIRAIDADLTLKEWIIPGSSAAKGIDIKKFKVTDSLIVDNSFIPWEPKEKKVSLGTGIGKSTHFARCLAHSNPDGGGVTLVVPYASLVGSVTSGHNKWLSLGKDVMKNEAGEIVDDPDKRVTCCAICEKKHTADLDEKGKAINPYQTKGKKELLETGPDCMINVLTWWEFLDAYFNNPEWIKPWVVFDEAHTDLPAYQSLIKGLAKVPRDKRPNKFGIVQMSATFGDMPTSKKLTGRITDRYVTNFKKFLAAHPDFFKKKVIIFCDDFSTINFQELDDNKIKYIKLDDSVKDFATDIVRATSAPTLIFANRDYSVGFSFGDVNVISTGVSFRKKITGIKTTKNKKGEEKKRWEEETVPGTSDFADLLQERGRASRDKKHTSIWVSLVSNDGRYNIQDDYAGVAIANYFKSASTELKAKLAEIIEVASQGKEMEPLPEDEARKNLYKLLINDLKDFLDDPNKRLFTVLPSEQKVENEEEKKYVRGYGEYIFRSPLMNRFKEEDLFDLLLLVTRDKIEEFSRLGNYEWYKTKDDPDDDYIFGSLEELKPFGFYFQVRAKYQIVKDKTHPDLKKTELRLKFTPYKTEGKKKILAIPLN